MATYAHPSAAHSSGGGGGHATFREYGPKTCGLVFCDYKVHECWSDGDCYVYAGRGNTALGWALMAAIIPVSWLIARFAVWLEKKIDRN